jgi:hypothetical protein
MGPTRLQCEHKFYPFCACLCVCVALCPPLKLKLPDLRVGGGGRGGGGQEEERSGQARCCENVQKVADAILGPISAVAYFLFLSGIFIIFFFCLIYKNIINFCFFIFQVCPVFLILLHFQRGDLFILLCVDWGNAERAPNTGIEEYECKNYKQMLAQTYIIEKSEDLHLLIQNKI